MARSPLPLERVVEREGKLLLQIPACIPADHLAERVRHLAERWLRAQARHHLQQRVNDLAIRLNVTPGPLAVKDTRSRWGSCSARGNLSFNWRLIMAPPWIIDYLVAHELAHLRELNHSPRFWAVVRRVCPDYQSHRIWLRLAGERLMNW